MRSVIRRARTANPLTIEQSKFYLRQRLRSRLCIAIATLSLVCGGNIGIGATKSLPLGSPRVLLWQGKTNGYKWHVLVRRWAVATKRRHPCLDVSLNPAPKPLAKAYFATLCGNIKPFPLVLKVAAGSSRQMVTVAGMAFDQKVRKVDIYLSDHRVLRRIPRLISKADSRAARVDRFRSLAVVVRGGVSIGRVVARDAAGKVLSSP
jgi:hypothetical protein